MRCGRPFATRHEQRSHHSRHFEQCAERAGLGQAYLQVSIALYVPAVLTATAMAARREHSDKQAAAVLLALAAAAFAAPAAAQNATAGGISTGQSGLSLAAYPLNPGFK